MHKIKYDIQWPSFSECEKCTSKLCAKELKNLMNLIIGSIRSHIEEVGSF